MSVPVQKAKGQAKDITATTYKWDSTVKKFAAQTTGSLNVSTTKKISIVPNAYDNMSSQFTLLDVTYDNPTNEEAEPFHLYIPVLVKKVFTYGLRRGSLPEQIIVHRIIRWTTIRPIIMQQQALMSH